MEAFWKTWCCNSLLVHSHFAQHPWSFSAFSPGVFSQSPWPKAFCKTPFLQRLFSKVDESLISSENVSEPNWRFLPDETRPAEGETRFSFTGSTHRISDPQWKDASTGTKDYDSPGNHGRHAMGKISQPIQHLKIVFFLTLHAPHPSHPLTLGPKSLSFLPRQWAVDTAKEIYRFIHEKSRLREEVEKHNKVQKVDFFLKCLWCCLVILSL